MDRGVLLYLQENLTAGEQVGKALVSSQLLLVNGDLAVGAQDGLLIGQALGPVVPGADVVQRLLHAVGPGALQRVDQVLNALYRVEVAVCALVLGVPSAGGELAQLPPEPLELEVQLVVLSGELLVSEDDLPVLCVCLLVDLLVAPPDLLVGPVDAGVLPADQPQNGGRRRGKDCCAEDWGP